LLDLNNLIVDAHIELGNALAINDLGQILVTC